MNLWTYSQMTEVSVIVAFAVWWLRRGKPVNPNSLMMRFRIELAKTIMPHPSAGTAWCIKCSVNKGRTSSFPAENLEDHIRIMHSGGIVEVDVRWMDKKK